MRRKLSLWLGCLFFAVGITIMLGGVYLEKEYRKLHEDIKVRSVAGFTRQVPYFISPGEREYLEELAVMRVLNQAEEEFRTVTNQDVRDPFRKKADLIATKKNIHDAQPKIQGASWKASAARGQLLVRELILGVKIKVEDKELKQLWLRAANSYKEARTRCQTFGNVEIYRECVDTVTKSYELLVRPADQGGLGNAGGDGMAEEGGNEDGSVPLVKGRGVGAGGGSFGTR